MSAPPKSPDAPSRKWNGQWPPSTDEAQALARSAAYADDEAEGAREAPAIARARVWRRIEDRRRRAQGFGRPAMALSFVAVAALAVALGLRARSPSPSPAPYGERFAGRRFDDGARRRLDVHGDARVVLGQGSRAEIVEDDERGLVFSLGRGSLLADVSHRPAGSPFLVRAPRASVKVVGTVLWVEVGDDGAATVLVGRGAVEVSDSPSTTVRVSTGERWPAGSLRVPAADDLHLLGDDLLDGTRFAAPGDGPAAAAAQGPTCKDLPSDAAIPCLEAQAGSSDALRAESALYELGSRRLRDQGDARAALSTWERQRARFPSGTLRPDADVSIIEALVRLGDRQRSRVEMSAYLDAHPDGLAAPQVHFLRGTLERADGDCARALRELDLALATPAEPWAGEARAERAACLKALHR